MRTHHRPVGVPRETKTDEHRVAVTPEGVRELVRRGTDVVVEAGAGDGSGITDADFVAAGASIARTAADAWAQPVVVKVKEPQPDELDYLRPDLTLFTFLHLAAYPAVAEALFATGTIGIAYETVQAADGTLPLLEPMSEIAGRLAAQVGAHCLERHAGGPGILMGGAPGVPAARVVVIGGGTVGWNAARVADGMGGDVLLLDTRVDRLRWVELQHRSIGTLASNPSTVERAVAEADLVIGAVLVAGDRAPIVVHEDLVEAMKPRSVVIDVAVDQGGCVATTHETTHRDPTYVIHDVVHYAVGNMPGAVSRTSTYALANATFPYLLAIAAEGLAAARRDPALALGVNSVAGHVTNPAVAEALGREYTALPVLLER